jgi:hypothetical protein
MHQEWFAWSPPELDTQSSAHWLLHHVLLQALSRTGVKSVELKSWKDLPVSLQRGCSHSFTHVTTDGNAPSNITRVGTDFVTLDGWSEVILSLDAAASADTLAAECITKGPFDAFVE